MKNFKIILTRRHPDLNWGMGDLQSPALPLGYTAFCFLFFLIKTKIYKKLVFLDR